MMPPDLPWGIYIRTSTFDQGEKSSPLKQFMACLQWAKANGKTISGADAAVVGNKVQRGPFIFVDAQTGTNDNRPDLQRFLGLAKTGKIGGIVCYMVDRAARNLMDAIKMRQDLKRMKVGFEFAMQKFDDGPMGDVTYGMFAMFAELEAKLIAERTSDGRKKRILGLSRKDGLPRVQGPALFGYRLNDGIPVEDEKEGPAAHLMLRLAIDGLTCGKIAKALNEAGHTTREGKPFRDTRVASHLREAYTYSGVYRHQHGIEAAKKQYREVVELMGVDAPPLDWNAIEIIEVEAYPAMITRDEANLILARVEKNRVTKRGYPPAEFALAHYVWCDVCGSRWYAKKGKYYCGCVQLGKPLCDAISSAPKIHFEAAYFDGVRAYLRQPEVHYALALADYNANRGPSTRTTEEVEKEVKAADKEQAYYDEQATQFGLSKRQHEIAKKKSHDLGLRIAELNAELRQLRVIKLAPCKTMIASAFAETLALLEEIKTFAEKRRFVELTTQSVFTDGRQVMVTGKLKLQAAANTGSTNGTYPMGHLDSLLNRSQDISFSFNAKIPGHRRRGWKRKAA